MSNTAMGLIGLVFLLFNVIACVGVSTSFGRVADRNFKGLTFGQLIKGVVFTVLFPVASAILFASVVLGCFANGLIFIGRTISQAAEKNSSLKAFLDRPVFGGGSDEK